MHSSPEAKISRKVSMRESGTAARDRKQAEEKPFRHSRSSKPCTAGTTGARSAGKARHSESGPACRARRARPACRALEPLADFFSLLLARIIHDYCRETFETEARRGFSQVRPT